MVKGILFVLLALSSGAHARDTSIEVIAKKEAVVIVSVLDSVAFTQADIESLTRFLKKTLPRYEIIHITATTSIAFSSLVQPHQIQEVRESIKEQIRTKVSDNYKVSHLVIMDHGNISLEQDPKTVFKFLSAFGKDGVDPVFKEIFDPLVGKFTPNAFVMLESCLTVCDGIASSQKRIKSLMNYFKISNGTVFGAYQQMLSQGYDIGFHLKQMGIQLQHPYFIGVAIQAGLLSQVDVLVSGASFNLTEFFMVTLGTHVALPPLMKIFSYLKEKSQTVNWGYLYKFEGGNLKKVFEINPYENQKELYTRAEPKKFKVELNSCNSLFH